MKPLRERIGLNCCVKSSAGDDQWERRSEFLRTLAPFPHQKAFISFPSKLLRSYLMEAAVVKDCSPVHFA